VTVAVLDPLGIKSYARPESEFAVQWFSGTGKGGQYRNKHQNCCRLTHLATGIVQTGQSSRERKANMREATAAINKRLDKMEAKTLLSGLNLMRRNQVGSGMRGDKRRTYRFREDSVYDSVRGKEARCSDVMKGMFDLLW
jgi:peptide chain release factor 1